MLLELCIILYKVVLICLSSLWLMWNHEQSHDKYPLLHPLFLAIEIHELRSVYTTRSYFLWFELSKAKSDPLITILVLWRRFPAEIIFHSIKHSCLVFCSSIWRKNLKRYCWTVYNHTETSSLSWTITWRLRSFRFRNVVCKIPDFVVLNENELSWFVYFYIVCCCCCCCLSFL